MVTKAYFLGSNLKVKGKGRNARENPLHKAQKPRKTLVKKQLTF